MIFVGDSLLQYNLVLSTTAVIGGGSPLADFAKSVTLHFHESGTSLVGENRVSHRKLQLDGILVPSTLVDPVGRRSIYGTYCVDIKTNGYVSKYPLYDNYVGIGEDARISLVGKSLSGVPYPACAEIKTAWVAGSWCSATCYFAVSTDYHATRGRRLSHKLVKFLDPLGTSLAAESYFENNPTKDEWYVGLSPYYGYATGFGTYTYWASDGSVKRYSSSTGLIPVQTWSGMEAYLDALLVRTSSAPTTTKQSAWRIKSPSAFPASYRLKTDIDSILSISDESKTWLDSTPFGAKVKWDDDRHHAGYHISDLVQDAADGARYTDMNTLSYVADLLNFKSTLTSIAASAGKLATSKSVKAAAKATANGYLATRYGTVLTYQETRDLFSTVKGLRSLAHTWHPRATRSMYHDKGSLSSDRAPDLVGFVDYTAHCKIVYDEPQNALMRSIKAAMDWDIWPTLQNCWDWIPYSFVLDWMVPVDNLLNNIDNLVYLQYLNVRGVVMSTKIITKLSRSLPAPSGFTFVGSQTFVDYNRWVEDKVRQPNVFALRSPADFHNQVEAAALIVQKL